MHENCVFKDVRESWLQEFCHCFFHTVAASAGGHRQQESPERRETRNIWCLETPEIHGSKRSIPLFIEARQIRNKYNCGLAKGGVFFVERKLTFLAPFC